MKKLFCLLLIICCISIPKVYATSGALRKNSIKTCSNGITYGNHGSNGVVHWHQAKKAVDVSSGWIAIGDAIYSDPCSSLDINSDKDLNKEANNSGKPTDKLASSNSNSSNTTDPENSKNEENIKSNDNTLKSIIIDDIVYNILDGIIHKTSSEKVVIEAVPNDDKAIYDIKSVYPLVDGDNHISIVVTAESGLTKTYNIIVKKEKKLSSDVGIEVIINDKKIDFENYMATIYVDSSTTKLDINYNLENENAIAEMNEIKELQTGDNILTIKVIAEDGTQQQYEINIYKYSKIEDVIYFIVGLGIIGGGCFGIYKISKKGKILFKKLLRCVKHV